MDQDPFITHLTKKYQMPAYTDAVGTGSIFGPVLACAVSIPEPFYNSEVNDSKQVPNKIIYRLAPVLKEKVVYAFGIVSVEELLEIKNNQKGEHLAMVRALKNLQEKIKIDAAFVDGKFTLKGLEIPLYAIIKGDAINVGIAVASIIAKDERDQLMINFYGEKYSKYHISSNKGYRSPDHLMALRKFGPVRSLHRTYLPQVKQVLSGNYDRVIQTKYKDRWEKLCQK